MYKKVSAGFTLIELTVVIAIIAILVGITIQSYAGSQAKARDARRKTDLHAIQQSLEEYYNDHKSYPTSACSSQNNATCWSTGSSSFLGTNATNYMQTIPLDPLNGLGSCASAQYYIYTPANGGQTYTLTAHLENTLDSQRIPGATGCVPSYQITNP